MTIGEICNRDVVITEKNTGIVGVANLMREYHVGSVVVVEKQNNCNIPIGIITDRDIVVELVAPNTSLDAVTAGDIMATELISGKEIDGIWETLQLMRNKGIRRLPVVNDEQVLVGILTVDDLLDVLVSQLNDLVKLVSYEQTKEKRLRH